MSVLESYVCLGRCGKIFHARKDIPMEQRRCGDQTCRSPHIMPESDYNKVKNEVLDWMRKTPFGIVPIWDIGRVVVGKKGMKPTDGFTVALSKRLYRDIVLGESPTPRRKSDDIYA